MNTDPNGKPYRHNGEQHEAHKQALIESEYVNRLADAFLAWPLPDSVNCDMCATERGYPNRIGTHLLTVTEARQMFEHVLREANNQDQGRR